jgi:hypothetical protein
MHNFGRMLDSDRISRLRSHFLTPVDVTTSDVSTDSGCASWLRSMSVPPILPPQRERLRMARLDDCSILQPEHLVENRLGGTHDSISVQNLRSHNFACRSSQTMCRATKEHLACHDLRKIWVSGGTWYPTTLNDQGLQMSGQAST